ILGRRRRTAATVFGPDRTSRRLQGFATTTHHHHHADRHTSFAIRCEIAVMPAMRTRARPAPFLPWTTASATATPAAPERATPSLIERITAREHRVESSTTVHDILRDAVAPERAIASSPSPVTRLRTPPVAMIVRSPRSAPSAAPPGGPIEPPRAEPEERFMRPSVVRAGAMPMQPALSATELGRVTEHVVRAID